jgi:hypothetical protein
VNTQSKSETLRNHHVAFKYSMVTMALGDPDRFAAEFSDQNGNDYLLARRNATGNDLVASERLSSDGLELKVLGDGDKTILILITLPIAQRRNEAYYLAAILGEAGEADRLVFRVFGMEHSIPPTTGEPLDMVVEWDGHRYNYGPASDTSLDAFVAAIDEIAIGQRRAIAAAQMRLFNSA